MTNHEFEQRLANGPALILPGVTNPLAARLPDIRTRLRYEDGGQ